MASRPIVKSVRALLGVSLCLVGAGCWSSSPSSPDTTVKVAVHLRLRGSRPVPGPISGSVLVYHAPGGIPRSQISNSPDGTCTFDSSPTTTCEFSVPRNTTVTFIAVESNPSLIESFRAAQTSDTVRTGQYVEFAAWGAGCTEIERGACTIYAHNDVSASAEFDLMTQVTVYQIGAARLDYAIIAPIVPLTVPVQSSNILDGLGCSRLVTVPDGMPCDSVHAVGGSPFHRLTVYLTRNSALVLLPNDGAATNFREWGNGCGIFVGTYGCELVFTVRDTTGAPFVATLKYEYWQCAAGPSDHDLGGCTLIKP